MPKALYHIQLNVRDFARSLAFYKALGFEEDHGAEIVEGDPPLALTDFVREVGADPQGAQIVVLKLPTDPYGHIELACWGDNGLYEGWSPKFNSIGVVRICLLVEDLDAEVAALRARGIHIVTGPTALHMKRGGTTRFVFFKDPDENFVEFIEIKNGQ
jgi:catechol 2,3-dioxygenase-like lactoylglutathione lyase family enzyme